MSAVSTPTDSPIHAEPLHQPDRAAKVVVPQAPLGNTTNGRIANQQQPGMGAKALLAKTMAKNSNPKFISPTDSFQTPVSSKINAAKKKRFNKTNPKQGGLFQQVVTEESKEFSSDEEASESEYKKQEKPNMNDPENPF